jgi:formylglycine-generating enzyme required for sulfatase activity
MSRYKNFAVFMGLALVAVSGQTAEPTIKYEVTGNELIVTYTGTLYQSEDAVSWTAVPNAASPYQVKMGNKQLFFCSQGGGEVQPIVPGENFSTSLPGSVWLDMNWINPGTFIMGSPTDELGRGDDETRHQVTLTKGYWLGKYEVTQAQYQAVMGKNPSSFKGADLPVEQVSWNDAMNFCSRLTAIEKAAGRLPRGYEYTLPTEAQWEYACRAGTTTAFNNGKNILKEEQIKDEPCPNLDEVAWYRYNSDKKTHSVGQRKSNAWGLYDMHGNVVEWCLDWYDDYPTSAVVDPEGPAARVSYGRVFRGGCWHNSNSSSIGTAAACRSACRCSNDPDFNYSVLGFRVALVPIYYSPTPGSSATIEVADDVRLKLNWIEPGTFIMGSPKGEVGRDSGETQHEVTLTRGYWMGKYEVTQAQYEAVMGKNPSNFKGADLPVEQVSWFDAMDFCLKLTASERTAGRLPEGYEYTLPTEAQWEYACRAGTTTSLNSGFGSITDEEKCLGPDQVSWYKYNSKETTHPVGQKLSNAWGLYDMHGNVWEWCLDWYEEYPTSAVVDPTGADAGMYHVMRGGAWNNPAKLIRSASRSYNTPRVSYFNTGFRVALTPVIYPPAPGSNATIALSNGVKLDLNWIKPGTFTMGSPEDELDRLDDETQHKVTLTKGYWMGKYEITQAQYYAVTGKNPSKWKGADLPVERVTWFDAKEFCEKLTAIEKAAGRLPEGYEYTLPTEAQWEYACRAGTTTALNSGKDLSDGDHECPEMDEVGWYYYNSDDKTHPVGQKKPNAWGLYDMHGNVWEWCLDWYPGYEGSIRVIRGGGWYDSAGRSRSAYRSYGNPSSYGSDGGFRVALAPMK